VKSVVFVCCLVYGEDPAQSADPAEPQATAAGTNSAAEIRNWIRDLNGDQYLVRETATIHLCQAGQAAFDLLFEATCGVHPEAAERAIWILQQAALTADSATQLAALERLIKVQDRPAVASAAQRRFAEVRHRLAIEQLAELGGQFISKRFDHQLGQELPNRVRLDANWHGGDEGLRVVAEIRETPLVQIHHAKVTLKGLQELSAMAHLRELHVYGAELEPAELEKLRAELPNVLIDYRRGAMLGVKGDVQAPAAVVTSVQPGTAAAAAGILPGDIIRQLDGQSVNNFPHLVELIGKLREGDRASLQIARGTETFTLEVQFGKW
jgi:hypothetical protein